MYHRSLFIADSRLIVVPKYQYSMILVISDFFDNLSLLISSAKSEVLISFVFETWIEVSAVNSQEGLVINTSKTVTFARDNLGIMDWVTSDVHWKIAKI